MKKSIEDCLEEDVLVDLLKNQRNDVIKMMEFFFWQDKVVRYQCQQIAEDVSESSREENINEARAEIAERLLYYKYLDPEKTASVTGLSLDETLEILESIKRERL